MNNHIQEVEHQLSRREFLFKSGLTLGAAALGSLLNPSEALAGDVFKGPHFAPKDKRIIY